MSAPRAPQGPRAWMEWGNALADAVDGNEPIGPGVTASPTGAGKFIAASGAGSAAASSAPLPWQPYPEPYTGSGSAPSGWGLRFMIRQGFVWNGAQLWTPENPNQIFVAPANCTDGYFVWLDAAVDATGLTTGLDYGADTTTPSAVTIPTDGSGTPPPHAYDLLLCVVTTATGVDYANTVVYRSQNLSLTPVITDLDAGRERRMIFQA